jgi:hypothetical protein
LRLDWCENVALVRYAEPVRDLGDPQPSELTPQDMVSADRDLSEPPTRDAFTRALAVVAFAIGEALKPFHVDAANVLTDVLRDRLSNAQRFRILLQELRFTAPRLRLAAPVLEVIQLLR